VPPNCTDRRTTGKRSSARVETVESLRGKRDERGTLLFQRKPDFQRHLPVGDFAVVDIAAGLGHLEPPHAADRLARARQRIADRLLHSVRRGANDLNFLVNVFSHTPIVCRSTGQNNKNPLRPGNVAAPVTYREFALQTNTRSRSLAVCAHRLQSGRS
jgi:hypothetical protein